jgi:large subunit ribosomal protein L19
MNILQKIEQVNLEKLSAGKRIDKFDEGDTVIVNVKIVEGATERVQAFEGLVIARKNSGVRSAFTVRKISHGEGVERVFPLYSPRLESVVLVRKGNVRRAKLYYIRRLTGKTARITEKLEAEAAAPTAE